MSKAKYFSIVFFLAGLSTTLSFAQQVTATAGDYFVSSGGSLSWTLGELMTETFQSSGFLTQGFHQPAVTSVTGIEEQESHKVLVYPNPARDILNLQISEPGSYVIELYDLQGKRVLNQAMQVDGGIHVHQFSILDFRTALYLLRVKNTTTDKSYSYRIEKL